MNYSAANVVKKSAKQLFYLATHPSTPSAPAAEQIAGVEYQLNVTKSPYVEMGAFVNYRKHDRIYFTFDEVKIEKEIATLIEHKMVSSNSADWYFTSSLIQAATYKALFLESQRTLHTARFYRLKTGKEEFLDLTKTPVVMLLHFGPRVFKISLTNKQKLLQWFYQKIDAARTWNKAVEFDKIYKHKEWSYLKDCIKYVEMRKL